MFVEVAILQWTGTRVQDDPLIFFEPDATLTAATMIKHYILGYVGQ